MANLSRLRRRHPAPPWLLHLREGTRGNQIKSSERGSWVRARSDRGTWEHQNWVGARAGRENKKAQREQERGVSADSRTFHAGVDGTLLLPGSCTCAKAREEVSQIESWERES